MFVLDVTGCMEPYFSLTKTLSQSVLPGIYILDWMSHHYTGNKKGGNQPFPLKKIAKGRDFLAKDVKIRILFCR